MPFKIDDVESRQFLQQIQPQLLNNAAGMITVATKSYKSKGNPYQEGVTITDINRVYNFAPVSGYIAFINCILNYFFASFLVDCKHALVFIPRQQQHEC